MFPFAIPLGFLRSAGKDLILTLASMIPVVELRGAVPLGAALNAKWYHTLLCTATGNLLPVPFVLRRGDGLVERLRGCPAADRLLTGLRKFMDGRSEAFRKNAALTLILVIAVPFTGIGAWGASLIANLLGLDQRRSLAAIAAGILISGALMTLCTYGLVRTAQFFL